MTDKFTHLHVHSYYSYLDGQNSPKEICEFAKDMGQTHVAITDHGTMAAHHEFFKAAEETGITPVPGVEAYITYDRFRKKIKKSEVEQAYNHIILLAKNDTGLKTIRRLQEEGWNNGFYYKPRIDLDILEEEREGIIVLSGCFNGLISKALEREQYDHAQELTDWFKERFQDDFYMEIQPHNPKWLNDGLLDMAFMYDVKPVLTQDCHYTNSKNKDLEEVMLAIATSSSSKQAKGKSYKHTKGMDTIARLNTLFPDRGISFQDIDVFMSAREELEQVMKEQGYDRTDMFDSTQEITAKIEGFNVPRNLNLLPKYSDFPADELREAALEGLKERGVFGVQEYMNRLDEELEIIKDKKFSTYFLIVADMVRYAKDNDILVGGGRGSAAGSLVCYALGITEFDPLEYDLLFFRFINPERNDYPDIDIDFEDRRRGEVKEYLRNRWGNVAAISTFSYFKDKMVVKDVSRVFGVPLVDVSTALKKVNTFEELELSTEHACEQFRLKYPDVLPMARRLRGKIRNSGVHPAGMVISEKPIWHYLPVEAAKEPGGDERVPIVANDMDQCAEIGLIKVDVLGLKTLAVIKDALGFIEQRTGKAMELTDITFDDPAVYEMLDNADTLGVFQCEATPYRRLLNRIKISNFEDLAASNALVRPGPAESIFAARQKGDEVISYPHEILKPILENTYGVFIYQEQLMQAAVVMGGFSWSEADKLRKIVGKKQDVSEFDQFRDKWIDGATRYVSEAKAKEMWVGFEKFAGYGFNRAHAVSYSALSYQTAWLKHYYPLEFMCAILRNESQPDKRTSYLLEASRMGIDILTPHVNHSDYLASIHDDKLLLGLCDVKYVSTTASERIIEHRPFKDYEHFMAVKQKKGSKINSRVVSAMKAVCGLPGMEGWEPKPDDMYEYLGIPSFNTYEFPDYITDKVTDATECDQDAVQIVRGMCKGVYRKNEWTRVEFEDETGAISAFGNDDTDIEDGRSYFALYNHKSLMRYVSDGDVAKALKEGSDDAFVNLLIAKESPTKADAELLDTGVVPYFNGDRKKTLTHLVSIHYRNTKAGKPMADAVFLSGQGELKKVLIFQRELGKILKELKGGVGENMIIKTDYLKDGTLVMQDAITAGHYREIKGL